jgi:ABC-2 type transport system ATP-binding protein
MNDVEELCDRLLMINKGRTVLYGSLNEIKSRYRHNSVLLDVAGELGEVPGVITQKAHKDYVELVLDGDTTPQQLLERLVSSGITIKRFEIATPTLNEIFLKIVGERHE